MTDLEMETNVNSMVLTDEQLICLIYEPHSCSARLFYFLSKKYCTVRLKDFKKSYIFRNIKKFNDDELYYIYEGLRAQIEQNFNEVYFLLHHLIMEPIGPAAQEFLIYLVELNDFRFREYLYSFGKIHQVKGTGAEIFKNMMIEGINASGSSILIEEMKNKGYLERIKEKKLST